jgi:hypothetical protein
LLNEELTMRRLPDTKKEQGISLCAIIKIEIDIKRVLILIRMIEEPIKKMIDRSIRNHITGITIIIHTKSITSTISITSAISITSIINITIMGM